MSTYILQLFFRRELRQVELMKEESMDSKYWQATTCSAETSDGWLVR